MAGALAAENYKSYEYNLAIDAPLMYITSNCFAEPEYRLSAQASDHPSGFETNAGSFRSGKNKGANAGPSSGKGFREWKAEKDAAAGKQIKFVPPEEPTAERKAKGDRPKKTKGGFYRAPPPFERLKERKGLHKDPRVAEAMCRAADTLYSDFFESGLNGVRAQDLSREVRGGGMSGSGFPRTERAMHHRRRFREAVDRMGWYPDHPFQGCGRVVVDVVCYDLGVSDAAKLHIGNGKKQTIDASCLDRLREGLFILAKHWRLI